ncbi:MAG TPA: hypothetical protein VFT29_13105 [Gemmatimonadaceae bacterium]|nr:hypothetical protein [Gemmatimonadaceae bacterium]
MPVRVHAGAPTLFIRKSAYERTGLVRAAVDERLGLTSDEFHVEGDLVVVGPIYDDSGLAALLEEFERLGLVYYDDFFELSGNWPDWLVVLAGSAGAPGLNSPSQPQR